MADNLGNITFSQVNFYAKGVWTDKYYNLKSVYAGLSNEGEYHFVDKIILPSFTKQTYPFTLSITASILKGAPNSSKAGTAKMWLYDYDPTGAAWASTPAAPPSNYIGYGEGSYSGLTQSHQYFDFTVTISNTNLVSGGTYYLWVDTTTYTTWQYDKQISGTLNGTDVKTLTLIKGTGISEFTGDGDYAINSKAATTVTASTGYHLTKYSGTNYNGVGTGEWAVSGTSDSTEWTMGADRTITAHAAINTYTVSYDANGGSGAPAAQTKTYGVNLTLSSIRPTKANTAATGYKVTFNPNGGTCATADSTAARTTSYTFSSWNTAANGTGTTYNAGATYSANANLTLYAQYSSSTATSAITLPAATRTGYTFLGWSTSSSATSGSTGSYTPTGATTLYAVWSINSYSLYINLDGGTWNGHTSNQTIGLNYGSTQSMPVPTKTGYTFGGWAWTTHGTMDKSKFACSVLSYEPAHKISVYNNKQNGAVTHTYVSGSSDKGKYDDDYIVIRTTGEASPGLGGFVRSMTSEYNSVYCHVFYAKLPVGYYFTYHNNALPTGSTHEWLTNNTGTGQWQIYAYRLTTGSSGSTSTFGYIAANANAGSPTTVTWYLGANQITKSPTSSQTFTAGEGNTWMYPLWIPNRYSVTYNGNGATSGSMSNSIATYNAGFKTKQNAFVRPGYEMSGWNEKADGSGTWWYLDRPGTYESGQDRNWNYTKNITLYAQWEPNGTVRIWNGSKWVLALPFIYTGATKGWIQAIPYTYVNNTDKWKLCGG